MSINVKDYTSKKPSKMTKEECEELVAEIMFERYGITKESIKAEEELEKRVKVFKIKFLLCWFTALTILVLTYML